MARRTVGQTVKNLALALMNATLLLAALCLWLAWGALSSAERVAAEIGDMAGAVLPLRAEIGAMTQELAAARAELAARDAEGARDTARIAASLEGIEARLDGLAASVATLTTNREALIERAVAGVFDRFGGTLGGLLSGARAPAAAPP